MSDEILFERRGDWGVITLNRPEALNALNQAMCQALRPQLEAWADDAAVKAIMVLGAGDRAFCAGGDIRWLHDTAKEDPPRAAEFFQDEYRCNAAIKHFPKPYLAVIDGVTMGGGVGLSVHGPYRIAGDNTLFAMPETGIGLFPDVGGGYFMPRLEGGLGNYLGLVGTRLKAADCLYAGIATHYAPSEGMEALIAALTGAALGDDAAGAIDAVLAEHARDPGEGALPAQRADIDRLFQEDSLDAVMAGLEADGGEWAQATLETLSRMSPTSMRLTFAQFQRGRTMDFDAEMKMEFRLASRVMEGHDFFEGVRAQIIDKDRNPKWSPATLAEVSDAEIEAYFADLGDRELVLP